MGVKTIFTVCISFLIVYITVTADAVSESKYVMKINRTNSDNKNSANLNNNENGNENDSNKRSFLPPDLYQITMALEVLPKGLCKNDSRAVLEAVISREKWALKIFDSSPKFPVGMLYGSYYQLGNFDECISVQGKLPDYDRKIQGKYCLADVTLDNEKENRIARSHGYYHNRVSSSRNVFNSTLRWAICVPSSCNSQEIEAFLGELFSNAVSYPIFTIEAPEINCYYEKYIPLTTLEIVFGCFAGIFVVFVVLATIYHVLRVYRSTRSINYSISNQNKPNTYQEILLSFSLVQNIRNLLRVKSSDLNLNCICGIRFLSMFLIVSSHSLLFVIVGPVLNEDFQIEAVQKPQNAILLNHPLLVDTFLLISGFLMCRLLLLELEKRNGKVNVLALYIGRYLRLTPSYFVVIALYCTFLVRFDSGPLWNKVISTEQNRCMTSWWANILYINNYVNTDNICMFQSWYLSADTQLFVLAPLIIYPLWKWPRIGETLLALSTLIAAIIPFVITFVYDLDPTTLTFPAEMIDITTNPYFAFAYIKTHMRAIAYCIGLVAGYIVHKLQSSNTKLSNSLVRISWILATIFGLSAVFSITVFYLPEHEFSTLESAAYSSLHKIAWSVSIGWVIIACLTDNSGPVKKFLSWSLFAPLSRLTYSAYLINGLIELHAYGTVRSAVYMSVHNMASITIAHFLLTFTAAFILCILLESPLHNLERMILRGGPRQQQKQQQIVDNAKL
ncbi:hypothetical protein ILUMI_06250 [Ignelater luminosus]|uniref:Nose resistant-to-fluoxetine protein N-terminal domain-containing protein n=1 Tax=Ignelater luminosus TaxID=2038154 RepID=A0A8K0D5S3_IGNLU|nr:hypothetical protein ILUMI_06250 [Ignelater luminosus]